MSEVTACFGANLKTLRSAAGLSQEELADRAAVHRTQISKFERAETSPSLETFLRLAGALSADPNGLLKGTRWVPVTFDRGAFIRGSFVRDCEERVDG